MLIVYLACIYHPNSNAYAATSSGVERIYSVYAKTSSGVETDALRALGISTPDEL